MKTIQLTLTEEQALQVELALLDRLETLRYLAALETGSTLDTHWSKSLEDTLAVHSALTLALYSGAGQ